MMPSFQQASAMYKFGLPTRNHCLVSLSVLIWPCLATFLNPSAIALPAFRYSQSCATGLVSCVLHQRVEMKRNNMFVLRRNLYHTSIFNIEFSALVFQVCTFRTLSVPCIISRGDGQIHPLRALFTHCTSASNYLLEGL